MAITKCCFFFDLRAGIKFLAVTLAILDLMGLALFSYNLAINANQGTAVDVFLCLRVAGCIFCFVANNFLKMGVEQERKDYIEFWLAVEMLDLIVFIGSLLFSLGLIIVMTQVAIPFLVFVVVFLYFWFTVKALRDSIPEPRPVLV